MRKLVWLDLCSGLGGASQPALDRGWKVIRVDIDPRFKPDIVADVRALPLKPFHVDVLWASPPCQEFARNALPWKAKPPWTRCECCEDFWCNIHRKHAYDCKCPPIDEWILISPYDPIGPPDDGIAIARACRAWVDYLKPGAWMIENTIHSRKWLTPHLGPVFANIAGHYFWGRIPCLLPDVKRIPKESLWPTEDRDAIRALIPYEIGEAICRAVEQREAPLAITRPRN